jgi:rhamnose transport system permease protein
MATLMRRREVNLAFLILLLIAVVSFRAPRFFSFESFGKIIEDTGILMILAMAQLFVIVTEGIDLSLGSTMGLTGMSVGVINMHYPGIPIPIIILIALAIGLILGMINGTIISFGNVPAIIATLGTMSIYRGLVFLVGGGQWVGAHEMTEGFRMIPNHTILGVSILVWVTIIVIILAIIFLGQTKTGREVYAVGGNRIATAYVGIRTKSIDFMVFAISGTLAGLGGLLYVSRYASAQNDTAVGFELQTVAACVIGGASIAGGSGSVVGVVLGAFFLGIVYNALTVVNLSPFYQMAIQGFVILVGVIANTVANRRSQLRLVKRRAV